LPTHNYFRCICAFYSNHDCYAIIIINYIRLLIVDVFLLTVNVQLNDSPLVTDVITANKVKNETIIAFVVSFVGLVVLVLVVLVLVVYFRKHIKLKIASMDHFLENSKFLIH